MSDPLANATRISRGEALAEQAYQRLRDAILSHQLTPGTHLSVPSIARRLGISRSPAREAIARIAHDGLAHVRSGRGAVVADFSPSDLVEIYELREVLEGLASRLAVETMPTENIERLEQILEEHQAVVARGDFSRHMQLDQAFHQLVRRSTGNSRLNDSLDRLQGQVRVAMHTTHRSPGGMRQAVAEHRQILHALRARELETAEQASRAHVARLLLSLRDTPGVGNTGSGGLGPNTEKES